MKQSNQKPVLRSKALHVRALQSNMSSEPRSEPPSQTSRLAIAPRSPPTGDLEARSTAEPGVSTAGATRPYITKPAGGEDFSKDDMRLLVNGYAAIMNLDEDQATDAWQALAAEASISKHVPTTIPVLTLKLISVSEPYCSRMAKLLY